ncbi:uncharacterized protein LOC105213483 isoform X1 [Zeugodacus cucurbitae]|uniref:uncharacterized protein LOC105213483 isoform X1 n=1 Tax=Zeugodacus cucurbitae TaxID=28588 RepID=UPI0023D8E3F8|nr:uncharacterized protein LOC105213483 isoform X1 [Zeugodacus cucurbitae]
MSRRRCALRCHTMRTRKRVSGASSNFSNAMRPQRLATMITLTTMLLLLLPMSITTTATASQTSGANPKREDAYAEAGSFTADSLQSHSNVFHKSNVISRENELSAREESATQLSTATALNYSADAGGDVLEHEGGIAGEASAQSASTTSATAINYRIEQLALNASEMRPQKQKLQKFSTATAVRNFTAAQQRRIPSKVLVMATSSTTNNNKLVTTNYMVSNNSDTNGTSNNNNNNGGATKWRQAIDERPPEEETDKVVAEVEERTAIARQPQQPAQTQQQHQQQEKPVITSIKRISGGIEVQVEARALRVSGSGISQSNTEMEFLAAQTTTAATTTAEQVSSLGAQIAIAASADVDSEVKLSADDEVGGDDYGVGVDTVITPVAKVTNNSATQMLQFVSPTTTTSMPTTTKMRGVKQSTEIVPAGTKHAKGIPLERKINNINSRRKLTSTQFQTSDQRSASHTTHIPQTTADYPAKSDFRTQSMLTQFAPQQPSPRAERPNAIQTRSLAGKQLPKGPGVDAEYVEDGATRRDSGDIKNIESRLTPLADLNVKLNFINKNAKSVKCDKQIKNASTATTIATMTGHEQAKHERAEQSDFSQVAVEATQQILKTAQEDCKITKCSKRLGAIVQGEQRQQKGDRRQPQKSRSESQLTQQQRYLGQAMYLVRPQEQSQGLNLHTEQLQQHDKHLGLESDFPAQLAGQQIPKEMGKRQAAIENKSFGKAMPLLNTEVLQLEGHKLAEKPNKVTLIQQEKSELIGAKVQSKVMKETAKNRSSENAKILITSTGSTMSPIIAQLQANKLPAEATETTDTIANSVNKQAANTSENVTKYNEPSEGQLPEEWQRALKYANNRDNSETAAAVNRWPADERLGGPDGRKTGQQPVDMQQRAADVNVDFNGLRQANKFTALSGLRLAHVAKTMSNEKMDAQVDENLKMDEVRERLMSNEDGVDTKERTDLEISTNNSLSYSKIDATRHAVSGQNDENVAGEEEVVIKNAEPEMGNLTKALRSMSTSATAKREHMELGQEPTIAAAKPDNCKHPENNGNGAPFDEMATHRAHEDARHKAASKGIDNEHLARFNGTQTTPEQPQRSKSILPLPYTGDGERAEGETIAAWQQQNNLLTAYIRRPDMRTGEALKLNDTLLTADGKEIAKADEKPTIQEPNKSSTLATLTTETMSSPPVSTAEITTKNNLDTVERQENAHAGVSQNEKANAEISQTQSAELPGGRGYKASVKQEYDVTAETFRNRSDSKATNNSDNSAVHTLSGSATSAPNGAYDGVNSEKSTTPTWARSTEEQWLTTELTTESNPNYNSNTLNSPETAAGQASGTITDAAMQAVTPPLILSNAISTTGASSSDATATTMHIMNPNVQVLSPQQATPTHDTQTTESDTSFFVLPNFAALTSTTTIATEYALLTTATAALTTPAIGATATPGGAAWPVKHASVMEGDVILGGLMMVHSREDSITCGPIMPQGGIQALEAMLYTLDQVNKHQLLPNITLGAHILDDCDKDTYGLEMAVDFIKGSISNIDDAEYHCNKTQVRKVISGVVGAASSVTSIQVANLLRLFRIPQVSFFSTSPELSNKQRFEYFSRTIPSDHYQVKAMVEIVKRMSWSYVSIIYEESNYGIKAFEELEELLARHNICIAVKEKLVKDSGVAEEIAYDNIVQKLLTKPRARGAIIFGSDQEVREVMRAVRRNNATGAFSWIGSDGWSARNLVSDGNEPEVEGTLSVQPQANPVKGFEEYFLNLTVENNQRNPWFVEFWEDHFQCRYPGSLSTPYNSYNRTCTTKERLSKDTDFEDQLQFVSDAVMAFAYALRDMHRDLCGGRPSLCDAMRPTKGADLLKYLRKVQFQGLSGDHFRFDVNGDGPARYNIIHFKQSAEGLYHWVKVGEYYEGELRLNMTEVQFKLLHPKPPESVCSLPCERGQAKKYVEGESCCWHCFNCSTYQIRHPIDETQCLTCQLGTLPDATKQYCQTIPEVYLRPESAWAIGAMAFSATGILVTLFVVGVFVRHNDTPIVRASGRELSYILLAGILMCYAVTFALVLKPTNIVCAIQRFSVGFCFTVVYAALLTKTNRIARIFKAGKQSAKRPSFISPKSQLVICFFLIFIQILINGVWMVIAPSHAMYHHPTREDNMLVCDSYIDASYMIAFFYPILLIVVCTVYAVLTRKIPEAFNESKHIGFTMYTTCVIWLAFVPLYFGTANHVPLRITSMSVTISLSASVTVACLFSPKLYIILIRPERNVRQSMMPPRYGNMHRTAGTGPSSMMAAAVVTAATCAQEEKIQKHITPTNTEHSTKSKKLCEMATQTITITNIFTNLDNIAYSQIPYADQYVPNNNHHHHHQQQLEQQSQQSLAHPLAAAAANSTTTSEAEVVANNNKINQLQHGNPNATNTATAVATTACTAVSTATAVAAISTVVSPPTLHALSNHVMLQQHVALHNCSDSATLCGDSGKPQVETTNL